MKTIKCSIKGSSPLLQHKMSTEEEAALDSDVRKRAGKPKSDNPELFLYKDGDTICQPAEHILQAIIKKLTNYRIPSKGKKTYKEMGIGSLNIEPELIPHKNQEYEIDIRTVVIPSTRGRTVRKRPRFNDWELDFNIEIINEDLPVEVVKGALDDAGRECGLGDYRPRFGRFIVTKFEE